MQYNQISIAIDFSILHYYGEIFHARVTLETILLAYYNTINSVDDF